ncbi:hypothetical protein EDL99_03295 [Ornithobacterium rhinotracheale]|nr:hypothetical protein [Ornithobacterium rhinotracheale]
MLNFSTPQLHLKTFKPLNSEKKKKILYFKESIAYHFEKKPIILIGFFYTLKFRKIYNVMILFYL